MLTVEDFRVYYRTEDGSYVHAVDGVNVEIKQNETLGLVGESGCGKTTLAKSLIRLLPKNAEIMGGSVVYNGDDITEYTDKEIRNKIRWKEMSMIPQNAMNGFDPVHTVGSQIVQVIRHHEDNVSKEEGYERARELFEWVGIEASRVKDYPHQFSGGMAQRAMIAMALALNPALLLADEPTTALDVVIQDRILQTIQHLQEEIDGSMIMITHDMSVVSEVSDRIAVMYGGQVAEIADAETIVKNPRHPYTLGLRNAFPDISKATQDLVSIPGSPPTLQDPDEGCRFAPRCPFAEEKCRTETPEEEEFEDGHVVRCHRADEADYLREEADKAETWRAMKEELEQQNAREQAAEGGVSDD
jgi:peptide/nickel transport system ATP-binding protein